MPCFASIRFPLIPRGLCTAGVVLLLVISLAASSDPPPLERLSSAPDGSELILVDGGSFAMGDVFSEGEANELPVHQVTLDPFYLADAEVTVGQFIRFASATDSRSSAEGPLNRAAQDSLIRLAMNPDIAPERRMALSTEALDYSGCAWWDPDQRRFDFDEHLDWVNPGFEQTADHPAVCLSWDDAASYANWVSELAGLPPAYDIESGAMLDADGTATTDVAVVRGYRLPTEAEWEYAARERGRRLRFGNGKDVADGAEATFDADGGDYPYARRGTLRRETSPVRSYAPNALGLYDMAGNAWEWVSDFLAPYPQDSRTNPYQVAGRGRAVRGGRWGGDASELRSAKRFQWQSNNRCNASGFRLARSPD